MEAVIREIAFALGYVADVGIVSAYLMVQRGWRFGWLDWANGVGAVPVGATEVYGHAWPALVVTCAFGVVGWHGVIRKTTL